MHNNVKKYLLNNITCYNHNNTWGEKQVYLGQTITNRRKKEKYYFSTETPRAIYKARIYIIQQRITKNSISHPFARKFIKYIVQSRKSLSRVYTENFLASIHTREGSDSIKLLKWGKKVRLWHRQSIIGVRIVRKKLASIEEANKECIYIYIGEKVHAGQHTPDPAGLY